MNKKYLSTILLLASVLLICGLTFLVYWRVSVARFLVSYDDELYVTRNAHVLTGPTPENIGWAFTTFETGNWHPFTWISHMLDCRMFGPRPGSHHVVNLVLHILNVFLLFLLLWSATGAGWKSAFVAALFALHPMHVESVAWVSERKDVLSTVFWLLSMLCYVGYAKAPGRGRAWYAGALASFALGLTAKPMLVTLPFALLVLDAWPLGRAAVAAPEAGKKGKAGASNRNGTLPPSRRVWAPLVVEKIPFFVLSLASCVVAVVAQSSKNAVVGVSSLSLPERIANAVNSYGVYLLKMIAPVNLACFYPFPTQLPALSIFVSLCALVAITAACLRMRRTMPFLLAGWLWYLGTLVPVIGLVQVGVQSMADRYTYVPYIGAFIMVAWGVPALLSRWRPARPVLFVFAAAVVATSAWLTHVQAGYWDDSVTLFGHAARVTKNNDVAYLNLGVAFSSRGKTDSAIACFNRALAARSGDPGTVYDAYNNIGIACFREHRTAEAFAAYERALAAAPNLAEAHFNLAATLAALGNDGGAIDHYRLGLRRSPGDFDAHNNLGDLLDKRGDAAGAADEYGAALRVRPAVVEVLYKLGRALARTGRLDESAACFAKALSLRPGLAPAHVDFGVALAMKGDARGAEREFREAVRLDPKSAEARADLGRALAALGDTAAALASYGEAVKLDSANADTRLNYGVLLASNGNLTAVAAQFRAVLKSDPKNGDVRRYLNLVERKK
jgi:protein O-mannosyl-transferase